MELLQTAKMPDPAGRDEEIPGQIEFLETPEDRQRREIRVTDSVVSAMHIDAEPSALLLVAVRNAAQAEDSELTQEREMSEPFARELGTGPGVEAVQFQEAQARNASKQRQIVVSNRRARHQRQARNPLPSHVLDQRLEIDSREIRSR